MHVMDAFPGSAVCSASNIQRDPAVTVSSLACTQSTLDSRYESVQWSSCPVGRLPTASRSLPLDLPAYFDGPRHPHTGVLCAVPIGNVPPLLLPRAQDLPEVDLEDVESPLSPVESEDVPLPMVTDSCRQLFASEYMSLRTATGNARSVRATSG